MSKTKGWRRRLPPRTARSGWIYDRLLSIVLLGLFLASWVGQFVAQATEVRSNAETHGQPFEWTDFWPQFLSATFENWQSEFLQLFTFVVLTALFIHRNSAESADGDDELKAMLEELLARTESMDAKSGDAQPAHVPPA